MGYIKHHAIVVTTWDTDLVPKLLESAHKMDLEVLCSQPTYVNGYTTIVLCPDGSKEGWDESDRGDAARFAFKAWLHTFDYEDGGSPLEWVEVAYGSDDNRAVVTDDAWWPR